MRKRRRRADAKDDQPSAIKTYNPPWMWSWWPVCPSELVNYPDEIVPIDQYASLATKKDRGSEPEMLAVKGPRHRDMPVRGKLL